MRLNKVTITGADEETDPKDLLSLYIKYPFVEWGILFSGGKAGMPKYPTTSKIMSITSLNMPLSAHFCGVYSREVLEKGNDFLMFVTHLIGFSRIQLNYNFAEFPARWSFDTVYKFNRKFPKVPVILQCNKDNAPFMRIYVDNPYSQANVLFDSSGGRGLNTAVVEGPFEVYTGYSGGLGPDNVEKFVQELLLHPSNQSVWIDMETNVRTGDVLDLQKVEKVLEICSKYMVL